MRCYSANTGRVYGYLVYEDPHTFYSALGDFLADGRSERFQSDVAFGDNGEINVWYISAIDVFLSVFSLAPLTLAYSCDPHWRTLQ